MLVLKLNLSFEFIVFFMKPAEVFYSITSCVTHFICRSYIELYMATRNMISILEFNDYPCKSTCLKLPVTSFGPCGTKTAGTQSAQRKDNTKFTSGYMRIVIQNFIEQLKFKIVTLLFIGSQILNTRLKIIKICFKLRSKQI